MDEIKEIENWIEQSREWLPIKYLLSRIKELEEGIKVLERVDGGSDVSYSIDAKRKLYKLIEKK